MWMRSVARIGRQKLGHWVPFLIFGSCIAALWPMLAAQDLSEITGLWRDISLMQWGLAIGFTVVSFWAVGKYDVLAHRHFQTETDETTAHHSGMAAIAVSQTLGAGLVTGSIARWRAIRALTVVQAAQITAFVTVLFLLSMAAIVGLLVLIAPVPTGLNWPAAGACLLAFTIFATVTTLPRLRILKWHVDLPGLRAIGAALGWVALDLVAACAAIYVLIPDAAQPPILAFCAVFCVALAAGITSGTPGGVGPFELVLLTLTATATPAATDNASLIVAICAFRLVYYALPAVFAGVYILCSHTPLRASKPAQAIMLDNAPRAELAVLRQTQGSLTQLGCTDVGLWRTPQAQIAMFDPYARPGPEFFTALVQDATENNRFAALYKCSADTASLARRAGWHVLHMADDAVIDLNHFATSGSGFSRLRRKLRKASQCGVTVRKIRDTDMPPLAKIDLTWQERAGTARGGTIGRFCPEYLRGQQVFVAEHGGDIIAFASFHQAAAEWTLDLMRDGNGSPDGTMYLLVSHAIEAARNAGAHHLCLAAAPACPDPNSSFWRWVAFKTASVSHSAGLRQFKSAFCPRWKPLYTASPTRFGLTVCAFDIARAVLFPGPVAAPILKNATAAHDNDEYYEVASRSAA